MSNVYYVLPLGRMEANCYIVDCGGGTAAVIDPGDEPEKIENEVDRIGLTVGAVLITHGHFDHVGAARAINERYGCPVLRADGDDGLPPSLAGDGFCTGRYGDGDTVKVGESVFRVISTPGHSRGSVCLECGDLLFTGDTLFRGACGRVDFPGGGIKEMRLSLARLAALAGDRTVLPGHGDATTLDCERKSNPYMIKAARR